MNYQFPIGIEIDLCVVWDRRPSRIVRDRILICPTHMRVSSYCTNLASLTLAQVEQGFSFVRASIKWRDAISSGILSAKQWEL